MIILHCRLENEQKWTVSGFTDSASSESFIDKKKLSKDSNSSFITSECKLNLYLKKNFYSEKHMKVLKDLCSNVLLGLVFQQQHSSNMI